MARFLTILLALLPTMACADSPGSAFLALRQAEAAYLHRLLAAIVALLPALPGAGPPNPSFYLINHADQDIQEVYVSPTTARGWGQDRLGDDTIDSQGYAPIRLLADGTCTFDLRVIYADGRKEERRGVNTCAVDDIVFGAPRPPAAGPQNDPSFRIVNRGERGIESVYARPAGTRAWGRDRLGDDAIDADSYRVIHMPAGRCLWDVRIVFDDRHATEKPRLNLCAITDLPVR